MGQRGLQNINIGGINYYWKNFYFINNRNYNWFYQNVFLNMFCNYFFIWIMYLNKFMLKFINSLSVKVFLLDYYYCFYKLRIIKLNFMFIWFLKSIIFRYYQWLIIYIEYYRQKKYKINKWRFLKKLRILINIEDLEGDAIKLITT